MQVKIREGGTTIVKMVSTYRDLGDMCDNKGANLKNDPIAT